MIKNNVGRSVRSVEYDTIPPPQCSHCIGVLFKLLHQTLALFLDSVTVLCILHRGIVVRRLTNVSDCLIERVASLSTILTSHTDVLFRLHSQSNLIAFDRMWLARSS